MTTMTTTTTDAQRRLDEEPDFVNLKRFGYSLEATVTHFPDGAPDKVIAAALLITEDDVQALWAAIAEKLRVAMKVDANA
jgi:hypothetical protein